MQSSGVAFRRPAQASAWVMSWILLSVFLVASVQAADEDTSSSVYLVFDPETGDFITSDSPEHALPSDTGLLEEPAAAGPGEEVAAEEERGADSAPLPADTADSSRAGLIVAFGAAVILGAGVFFFLRRQKVVGSDRAV